MAEPKVFTDTRDRAFVVTINRPDVRNCVDGETAALLFEAVETFRADDSLDALILTGAGDVAFCAGADLKGSASLMARPGAHESGPMGFSRIINLDKPTIAAVNGYCLAGGLELACWCDFRIADEMSQFGVLNRRWGVPLVDGGTQRLARLVGRGQALRMLLTGEEIEADEALRIGLVQLVGGYAEVTALARQIASSAPIAARYTKEAVVKGMDVSLDQGMRLEADLSILLHTTRDRAEGIRSFLERRSPRFRGK